MAPSTAKQAVRRYEELLKATAQACEHVVSRPHDGTWQVTVNKLVESERKVRRTYVVGDAIDKEKLLHDLRILKEYDWIDYSVTATQKADSGEMIENPIGEWLVVLKTEGLTRSVELEKWWLRRAYESNPPAWWLVILTAVSTAVGTIALLKSYGWI